MSNEQNGNQGQEQPQPSPPDPKTIVYQPTADNGDQVEATQSTNPVTLQMAQPMDNTKKPIYKKWWFWAILIVVILAIIGGAAGGSGTSKSAVSSSSAAMGESSGSDQASVPATEAERTELRSAIDEAKAIDVTQYTNDTATSLTTAISSAEEVYADVDATSAEVESATNRLSTAKTLLKEKVKPVTLTGSGDDVVDIPSNLATCLVTAEYSGGSNFVIKSLDASGDSIDLLVNTIGAYSGTTTTGKGNGTPVFLEVSASGSWTITLKPVADADVLTSGQPMHGDNVVMASTGSATKLTITNSGESNFVVYGISSSSSKLLVNEIGDYSGTVVNNGFSMFIVESEGDWSISW